MVLKGELRDQKLAVYHDFFEKEMTKLLGRLDEIPIDSFKNRILISIKNLNFYKRYFIVKLYCFFLNTYLGITF